MGHTARLTEARGAARSGELEFLIKDVESNAWLTSQQTQSHAVHRQAASQHRLQGTQKLGFAIVPFYHFFWGGGSPTKIDYRKKGTLILTSLLEDLENQNEVVGGSGEPYYRMIMGSNCKNCAPAIREDLG